MPICQANRAWYPHVFFMLPYVSKPYFDASVAPVDELTTRSSGAHKLFIRLLGSTHDCD